MTETSESLSGKTLAGYRVEARLSQGPLGDVYRAVQVLIRRPVVLKFLAPHLAAKDSVRDAFCGGARAAARLSHRNIVRIFDVHGVDGHVFYSSEFLPGGSLEDRLRRGLTLSDEEGTNALADACAALRHAEESGLVHGAIQPSHLLFTEAGEIKVLNLGVAHRIYPFRKPLHRRSMASLAYAAPEQVETNQPTAAADVYSLGCTIYHALAGRLPVSATTKEEYMLKARFSRWAPLAEMAPHVSKRLAATVERMLEPDVERRYGSFQALAMDLPERPTSASSKTTSLHVSPLDPDTNAGRMTRGGGWRGIAVALLVLVMVGLGGWFFWGGPTEVRRTPVGETPAGEDSPAVSSFHRTIAGPSVAGVSDTTGRTDAAGVVAPVAVQSDTVAPTPASAKAKEGDKDRATNEPSTAKLQRPSTVPNWRRLTDTLLSAPRRALARFRRRLSLWEHARQALNDAEMRIAPHIAALSFDAARETLEGASVAADMEPLRRRRAALAAEVNACEAVFELLRNRLQDPVSRRQLRLRWTPPGGSTPNEYTVHGFKRGARGGEELTLRSKAAPTRKERLLDLPPALLVQILAPSVDPEARDTAQSPGPQSKSGTDDPSAPAVEADRGPKIESEALLGLGAWYFCREGPSAAVRFATKYKLAPEILQRFHRRGERLLRSSVLQVTSWYGLAMLDATEDDEGGDARTLVRERVEELVERHRGVSYYERFREELAAIHGGTTRKRLADAGVAGLFAGKVKTGDGGRVTVTYRFESAEELSDFVVVQGELQQADGGALLNGEIRLKHGDPFADEIKIQAQVVSYLSTSPNINFAVWTQDVDKVTSLGPRANQVDDADKPLGPGPDGTLPNDYLAFGVGYRLPGETLHEAGLTRPVATMPAFVVLGGVRGIPLHFGHGQQVYYTYWAESVGNRIRGPQQMMFQLSPAAFRWVVNHRILHRQVVRKKKRAHEWLRRPPARGSITLFTNGHEVGYRFLSVESRLRPEWVNEEIERRVKEEFRSVEEGAERR